MTPEAVRLEALKLTAPSVQSPDLQAWVERARVIEAYITGAGQPSTEAPQTSLVKKASSTRPDKPPVARPGTSVPTA